MTVATKTKQKLSSGPDISQIKFRQKLVNLVWKFREKHEQLKKSTSQILMKSKQKILEPDRQVELER